MKIVICGGGIVGVSTAYYLAKRGVACTVIDRCEIACAASGKAGGFLAKDWCDSYELGALARTSFDMHTQLSQTLPDCDYRRLDTYAVEVKRGTADAGVAVDKPAGLPGWVDGDTVGWSVLGGTATTAQVHPYKLTHALMEAASELVGSKVQIGVVEGIEKTETGQVTGVNVNGDVMPADVVVVAMGPWSGQASQWLHLPAIRGQRAHTLLMKPQRPVTAHALFVEFVGTGGMRSPEVYPRPDGEVFVCGMSDHVTLPDDPAAVKPSEESIKELKGMADDISSNLAEADILSTQGCFLPISPDGLPLIGKIPGLEGAFIAGGHSCWGILTAPATGAALTELILDGKSMVVDLAPFDPARFS